MILANKLLRGMGAVSGVSGITDSDHPDLTVLYTMDNRSGSILFDESPNNNDANLQGAGALTVSGHIGNALDFNGTNDGALTGIVNTVADQSVCMWVNFDTISVRQFIFGDINTAGENKTVRVSFGIADSNFFEVTVGDGTSFFSNSITFGHTFVVGTYKFLVWTVEGTNIKIYEDSVLKHTVATGITAVATAAGSDWDLANIGGSSGLHLDGKLDQVRRFNRPLIQSEINELFNGGVGA